jgi:hypothetical protein
MADIIRIQDLSAAEISELLRAGGSDLAEREAAAIKDVIRDIGGVENAWSAIQMLDKLKKAA